MTFTIIAHLIDAIIATDISEAAVTLFLSNRIDVTRYTVVASNGASVSGGAWLAARYEAA